MNLCQLKGTLGDSLHAVQCAPGFNIRWLWRMIVKMSISLFYDIFVGPIEAGIGQVMGHGHPL
jgi:IS5 family transposase